MAGPGRPRLVALLAGLVVLAGCSSLLGLGGPTDRTASPATTTPDTTRETLPGTTEEPATPTPGTTAGAGPTGPAPGSDTVGLLPPGVTADGQVEPLVLARAHGAVLRNRSVRVAEHRAERYADGRLRRLRLAVAYAGAGERYYLLERVTGSEPTLLGHREGWYERWGNASVGVTAITVDGRTVYDSELPGRGNVDRFDRLYRLLSTLEPTVVDRRRVDGTPVVVLGAARTTVSDDVDPNAVENLRTVSLVALVEGDGLVRAYRLRYTGSVGNETVHVVERVRFEGVGTTTVPRPAWIGTALRLRNGGSRPANSSESGVLNEPPGRRGPN